MFLRKKLSLFIILAFIFLLSYSIFAAFPGGITITTPVTLQNISGSLTIEATIDTLDDNTNVSNVTFEFDNGNGTAQTIGVNTTENLTTYSIVWDTTGEIGEGTNFTINVTADYVNQTLNQSVDGFTLDTFTSNTTENVTVDNTGPSITLNAPTDLSSVNITDITFNFTVSDLIFTTINDCNLTLDPLNSSGGSIINTTTNIANGTETIFINSVETGTHSWNVACVDSVDTNNTGYSSNISFNSGGTAPDVSVEILDLKGKSKTKFGATDSLIISCKRSDEDGFNQTIISVIFPNLPGFVEIENVVESVALNDSSTLEVTFDQTKNIGDYLVQCEVLDVVGNTNATNTSFTIEKKVREGTSAFANKNFVEPVAKIKIGAGSVSNVGSLPVKGVSRLMQERATVTFTINGQEHSVTVKALEKKAVVLTIASTPFDITLNENESRAIDLDQDKKSDIKVVFHKLFGKYADLTISVLSSEEREQETKEKDLSVKEREVSAIKQASGALFVIVFIVLAIIVIGYFLIKAKKK